MGSLSRKGGKQKVSPHMNVTPLVDVVLVLLIIFMVVLPATQSGFNLELPQVVNADEPNDGPEPIVASIDDAGRYYIQIGDEDQAVASLEDLERALLAAHLREPNRVLALKADRGLPYVKVREVVAAIQGARFPGVNLRLAQDPANTNQAAAEGAEGQE